MPLATRRSPTSLRAALPLAAALLAAAACAPAARPVAVAPDARPALPPRALLPLPRSVQLASPADSLVVDTTTAIVIDASATPETEQVAAFLARTISRHQAGTPRRLAAGETRPPRAIHLRLDPSASHGEEGYELVVERGGATLVAARPAGLFYGVQTIRQLLPWSVEHPAAIGRRLAIPAVRIADAPRFAWRGMMLDVSRHFLPAADVKRFIDLLALHKMNRMHLHLADDQGWRIEITSWPNLAGFGGRSQVGGGRGGFYTQAEYADIVAYATSRFVTVVPEIDMPGHTNAALSSYAGLNCDGVAPPPYHGTRVGFSAICVDRDSTWKFVSDVVREISALTPGGYFHIGGDEVEKLTHAQYLRFVERAQEVARGQGRTMVGWGEIAPAALHTSTIVQHWRADSSAVHAARGGKVLLSPARKMYLDMKYDSGGTLGLTWAAVIPLRDAYEWDPATYIPGVGEGSIVGLEAPLWSETIEKRSDFEYMAFPRLAAIAEAAWTPQSSRAWDEFRLRLAAHGQRLAALGVNFYRSPQVPW